MNNYRLSYECNCQYSYQYSRSYRDIMHSACVPDKTPFDVVIKIRRHEKINNILWLVIGIMQFLCTLTFPLIFFAGVWNIINSVMGLFYIKNIRPHNSGVIEKYENDLISIIMAIGINLILGGGIGVILCVHDLYIRHYVLKNQYAFL